MRMNEYGHNEINGAELDRWITGNYGEDQFHDEPDAYEQVSQQMDEMSEALNPLTEPIELGLLVDNCFGTRVADSRHNDPPPTDEDFHATPPYLTGLESNPSVYEPGY